MPQSKMAFFGVFVLVAVIGTGMFLAGWFTGPSDAPKPSSSLSNVEQGNNRLPGGVNIDCSSTQAAGYTIGSNFAANGRSLLALGLIQVSDDGSTCDYTARYDPGDGSIAYERGQFTVGSSSPPTAISIMESEYKESISGDVKEVKIMPTTGYGGACSEGECKGGYICLGGRCNPEDPHPAAIELLETIYESDCSGGEGISYKYILADDLLKTQRECAGVFRMGDRIIHCGDKNLAENIKCGGDSWSSGAFTVQVVEQLSSEPCLPNETYTLSQHGGGITVRDGCKAKFERSDGMRKTCESKDNAETFCWFS